MDKIEDLVREEEIRKKLRKLNENFELDEQNLQFLYDCLSHISWRVRKDAVEIAVTNPDIKVIKLLINGLGSEDNAGLRNACQEALTKIGKKSAKYLIEVFDESDKDVRKFIVDIIGDIGDQEYAEFLIKALSDEDENVVIAACENLGKLKCKSAVPSLLSLLDASNQWLSFVILESISQIGYIPDAISLVPLWKVNPLRKPILDLLPMINPEYTIEIFRKAFGEKSSYVVENAVKSLYRQFNSNKEKLSLIKKELKGYIKYNNLLENLIEKGGDDEKAYALCAYISEVKEFFLPFLEKASNEALEFFGNLQNYAPFENKELILSLIDSYSNAKQAYLVYLCGVFKIVESLPILKRLCSVQYGHTRQAVAFSLGKIGKTDAIECLIQLLFDEYPDVREQAIKSLSLLLTPENFPKNIFEKILNSENKEHIIAVLELISNLKYYEKNYIEKALKSHIPSVRAKALEIIGKLRLKDFLQETMLYLTDEDEEVQLKAIESLGNIGNEESVNILSNFLDRDDMEIKRTAIISIYKLSPRQLKHVEEKIFNDIHPLLFFTILELFVEGVPFSTTKIIDTAVSFDDEDIYKEVINALIKANKINDLKMLLKTIEAKKGKDFLEKVSPPEFLEE